LNGTPSLIGSTTPASGGDNNITYQWKKNGTVIGGSNSATYTPLASDAATAGTYTYTRETKDGACANWTAATGSWTLTVYQQIAAGTITGTQTICYSSSPSQFSFSTNPSGAGISYTYQWQSSTDGTNFNNIAGAINATYQAGVLTATIYYHVVVISSTCGTSDTSNTITISVLPELISGNISEPQLICYNTAPSQLTSTAASGGTGSYISQWEQNTTGTWTNATGGSGATTANYTPPALTTTTQYRLKTTSENCGTVTSNAITITVYPNIVAATITTATTNPICYNTVPQSISIQTAASGGNDSFSNQWQALNGSTWSDISGEIGNAYQPGNLTATTQYRLTSTSNCGCETVYSNIITINVYAQINAGTIRNQSICYNTPVPIAFTTAPSGGGDLYFYQWQQSTNGTDFSNIPSATSSSYHPAELTQTTWYQAIVTSQLGCSLDTSNVAQITVYEPFETGKIAGEDTICQNVVPQELQTVINCSGADGNYSYLWQQSLDNVNFTDILGATNQNYQPAALSQTTYYRLRFSSDYGCGVLYSNVIKVWVIPAPTTRELIGEREVCMNQSDLKYSFAQTEENIEYQWSIQDGDIIEQIDDNHIIVHWDKAIGNGILTLQQKSLLTLCILTTDYIIVKSENTAPDKTHILKKQNSNILICENTSPNIHYEWSYEELQTQETTIIPNSDCQYIMIPHTIDTTKYDYFVKTWFKYGETSCPTKTYWLKDVIKGDVQQQNDCEMKVSPNPVKENLSITLCDDIQTGISIIVQNISGQIVYSEHFAEYIKGENMNFNVKLPVGVYIVVVKTKDEISTSKIVIE
jgi:hypothetical protein